VACAAGTTRLWEKRRAPEHAALLLTGICTCGIRWNENRTCAVLLQGIQMSGGQVRESCCTSCSTRFPSGC